MIVPPAYLNCQVTPRIRSRSQKTRDLNSTTDSSNFKHQFSSLLRRLSTWITICSGRLGKITTQIMEGQQRSRQNNPILGDLNPYASGNLFGASSYSNNHATGPSSREEATSYHLPQTAGDLYRTDGRNHNNANLTGDYSQLDSSPPSSDQELSVKIRHMIDTEVVPGMLQRIRSGLDEDRARMETKLRGVLLTHVDEQISRLDRQISQKVAQDMDNNMRDTVRSLIND